MPAVIHQPDTIEKLRILGRDGQYDLACACGSTKDEHRKRGPDGNWIYPVTLPNGGKTTLFKTLVSNACNNDCLYCPLRDKNDVRRCTLGIEETADVFMQYLQARQVFGLFLSSGLTGDADKTMARINAIAAIVRRKHGFRGYIHLKILPGASPAAIEETLRLASAVSINIETPGAEYMAKLSQRKDFLKDIIEPMKLISRLTAKGTRYERVKSTTQFIVGAAGETDKKIVRYMTGLYQRLKLNRVYFSAYQSAPGAESLSAGKENPTDRLMREHRLYQVDFLMRKYGFSDADILFDESEKLSLEKDPKQLWAEAHPEFFPVNINNADKFTLLRVPGLGPRTVKTILDGRKTGRISRLEEVMRHGKLLQKAKSHVVF
ncbi:MAG: radical SAM protein [Planctomycetes bacterium]|nr:radical SAM protein [Planctomycetota bacterium]